MPPLILGGRAAPVGAAIAAGLAGAPTLV